MKSRRTAPKPTSGDSACAFETELGWIAILFGERGVRQLRFGFADVGEALAALEFEAPLTNIVRSHPLEKRLTKYAAGRADDFLDVEIDYGDRAPFTRRVLDVCRRIPRGETISYRELATRAGSPAAARAAGQVMATNCLPLIIPCHRVITTSGSLGGYSNRLGLAMKQRLLDMEAKTTSPRKR
jgi:methylated-DNA-[protein]-cysteine S-methyltransferase